MTRVTIDAATAAQLSELTGAVELCDANGRTVGLFQPRSVPSTPGNTPDISCEELDKFANEEGGRSLSEIIRDLEHQA